MQFQYIKCSNINACLRIDNPIEFCFYKLEPLTLIAVAPKQRNKKYYISIFCRI